VYRRLVTPVPTVRPELQTPAADQPARGSLLVFFALTFAVTWAVFIGVATVAGEAFAQAPAAVRQLLVLPGVVTPALVAMAMIFRVEGGAGLRALMDRVLTPGAGVRWVLFAAGYMAVAKLTVAVVHRLATGAWPAFGETPWYLMVVAIAVSTPVQAGEEIGWRGYALPRLAARIGLGRAGLLLGLVWGWWHLPLFLIPGTDTYGQSFVVYALAVTALSVAMSWLYAHTGGGLLLLMLMHASINNTAGILDSELPAGMNVFTLNSSPVGWLTVAVLWVGAAYFLVRMPRPQSA
jgi:membrane protease YdiL (CAAX protease family)